MGYCFLYIHALHGNYSVICRFNYNFLIYPSGWSFVKQIIRNDLRITLWWYLTLITMQHISTVGQVFFPFWSGVLSLRTVRNSRCTFQRVNNPSTLYLFVICRVTSWSFLLLSVIISVIIAQVHEDKERPMDKWTCGVPHLLKYLIMTVCICLSCNYNEPQTHSLSHSANNIELWLRILIP